MKTFDWKQAEKTRSPEVLALFKETYKMPITEDEFVRRLSELPRNKKHAHKTRSPSSARQTYRRLKKNFGFFA